MTAAMQLFIFIEILVRLLSMSIKIQIKVASELGIIFSLICGIYDMDKFDGLRKYYIFLVCLAITFCGRKQT